MKQIVIAPNPILTKTAKPVKKNRALERNLIATLAPLENAVGLAAPQIGVSSRMFAVKDDLDSITVFINPEITKTSFTLNTEVESCLSIPGFYYTVKRFAEIELTHESGVIAAKGYLARCIQHEIDHLNGVLISDKGKRIQIERT